MAATIVMFPKADFLLLSGVAPIPSLFLPIEEMGAELGAELPGRRVLRQQEMLG